MLLLFLNCMLIFMLFNHVWAWLKVIGRQSLAWALSVADKLVAQLNACFYFAWR